MAQSAVAIKKELIFPNLFIDMRYIIKEQPIKPIYCANRSVKSLRPKILVDNHIGNNWKGG